MNNSLAFDCLLIFGISLFGGLAALIRVWSDEYLHLFVSFGAGIFLGTVFIHLLPESMAMAGSGQAGLSVLCGYILVFFVERVLTLTGDGGYDHNHKVVSMTVLVGLSVHSLIEGMGLVVTAADAHLSRAILVSILAHKLPAAFALGCLFVLARIPRARTIMLLVLFSMMTPAGAVLLAPLLPAGTGSVVSFLTGLTAGSFLYVATGDLLPEVFHTRERLWLKMVLLILGIVVVGALGLASPETEGMVP